MDMQHWVHIKIEYGHATFSLDKDGQWTCIKIDNGMQHLVQIKMDNEHTTFSLDKDGQWTCNIKFR